MKILPAASANAEVCSIVALAGPCTMPKMTPWSSVGASSLTAIFGSITNMMIESSVRPIQAV